MAQHHRVPITLRLDRFEGPLDLLLYLIQSHELDISKVSVSRVTDQYLAYVKVMHELNFDIASEFLVMAATLIQWKSKAILPRDEEENAEILESDDPIVSQDELIRRLLEHQQFLAAGDELKTLPRLNEDVFCRPTGKPPIEKVWRDMDLSTLALSYQDTITRSRKRARVLKKETVSLSTKIVQFKDRLSQGEMVALTELMEQNPSRPEIVVTFLATLELGRLKKLRLYQNETYAPIYVELIELLRESDLQLATGFEQEVEETAGATLNG